MRYLIPIASGGDLFPKDEFHFPKPLIEVDGAPMIALVATLFPFNTHLAFYSTFWGGLALLLAALYAGSLLANESREPQSA